MYQLSFADIEITTNRKTSRIEKKLEKINKIVNWEEIYCGILDKGRRSKALSKSQKKRNKNKSSVRSAVEHTFAYLKERQNYRKARAKTFERNRFVFDMNCIIYNIMRANYLLERFS